eukprot:CAMPEP_0201573748 /NCGR_PEP_ID=MMETSP0190_2-20130828/17773_1 /ASSEMBLY_ACC=CAM_ASM_000263 /TAXON_ID=37353 /ORGANISM="Rosalina sp." /LENGTH=518 /DNA_ID=CAMNT_0048001075 /DNA_START=94 /DNA_END=1650 /DNA_ORIENTATION=+
MDDNEKFCRLIQILSEDGVQGLEFFRLDDFKGLRGLSSLLSRQPGEELFKIPFRYLFTDYDIEKHSKLSEIWKKHPKLLAEFQQNSRSETGVYPFILKFYYELIQPSTEFNRIWFSMFPRDLNGHTIAWSDKELKGCGNLCPIRRDTIQIQVWIKKTFKILKPIIEEFKETIFGDEGVKQFTESMVEFLCMTCRNRGVLLPISDGTLVQEQKEETKEEKKNNTNNDNKKPSIDSKLYHCFVPLGDFGNHKFGAKSSTKLELQNQRRHLNDGNMNLFVKSHPELMKKKFFEYDDKTNALIVRSQEQILSGGQICYEYTAAPNWELLQNFGFAVPYNPYDRVIVNITFDAEDPKRLAKELQVLNKMGVSSFIKRVSDDPNGQKYKYSLAIALTLGDACPTILLSANRVKLLSDKQLNELRTDEIAFMDRLILQNKDKQQNKDKDKDDVRDINKLKVLELNVLRSLQASLNVLWEGYKEESLIDPNECKHPSVNILYNSIRMILRKSIQILDQKVQDLGQD